MTKLVHTVKVQVLRWVTLMNNLDNKFKKLISDLKYCGNCQTGLEECSEHCSRTNGEIDPTCACKLMLDSADAIETLLKVVNKMSLWIFLNTDDEYDVYSEIGLTPEEMSAAGYCGRVELHVDTSEVKKVQ